ncbi:hypothetical protein [Hyphomicrobium sp. CS1BSMeth3]|uniref:hypothetical protein n=1 Tax=Hyphomicrobium sp. CS1BSMeth3 TaxID=1892844 RepID=UPI000930BB5B|nr:hypothetical protein [Hyphomicrobium sp. CS1BSMeth3]
MQDALITLDELLAPYEARPVTLPREEIEERRRGAALGKELNRLQGATHNAVAERLMALYTLGQVSHAEFVALTGEIGRRSLFTTKNAAMDAR